MSTIVTRAGKGSPLTFDEVDANFVNLNDGKAQVIPTLKNIKQRGMVEQYAAGGGNFGGTSWTPSTGNITHQLFIALRGKPYAVRAIYGNIFTNAYTMNATTVFMSPIEPAPVGNQSVNPTGSTAVTLANNFVVPAAILEGNVVYAATPWVNINPVERTDFPNTFYQVAVRSFSSAGGNPIDVGQYAIYNPLNLGEFNETSGVPSLSRWGQSKAGNLTAGFTGGSSMLRGDNGGQLTMMVLEFAVTAKVLKVVSMGDSITAGGSAGTSPATGKGSQYYSWVERAVNLVNQSVAASSYYLSHANMGLGGAGITNDGYNFMTNVANTLTALTPDVLVLATWTPNQAANTQALYDTNLGKVLQAIQLIRNANAVPLLWTGLPAPNVMSDQQETFRLQHNAMLRQLALTGNIALVDLDALMSNNAQPKASMISGLSDDSLHPNFNGQTIMANALAEILGKVSVENLPAI
jgi:lysophospholipase L1-like esterase